MVTQLVEGKKVKAHQYWPDREGTISTIIIIIIIIVDREGTTISLKGDAKVELTATSFQGDYHIRWEKMVVNRTYFPPQEVFLGLIQGKTSHCDSDADDCLARSWCPK